MSHYKLSEIAAKTLMSFQPGSKKILALIFLVIEIYIFKITVRWLFQCPGMHASRGFSDKRKNEET